MTKFRLEDEAKWPGWFFLFVAMLLLFAAYSCMEIHLLTEENKKLNDPVVKDCLDLVDALKKYGHKKGAL